MNTSAGEDRNDPPELIPGLMIDRYSLVERLGYGGMGEVWKAVVGTQEYALKITLAVDCHHPEVLAEIRQTYELTCKLRHKHICNTLKLVDHPIFGLILVMDYVQGVNLTGYRGEPKTFENGRVPFGRAREILEPIAAALDYLHHEGVLHRDVKPENILVLGDDGHISESRLIDFGIATKIGTAVSEEVDESRGQCTGTMRYMAPELLRKSSDPVSGATDQYALAAVAYELLSGGSPFPGEISKALRQEIIKFNPEPMEEDIPVEVEEVLNQGLSKNKRDRFLTCSEFVVALANAAGTA